MSRNFSGSSQYITLGDLSSARFLQMSTWTFLCFFRYESSGDENCFISKYVDSPVTAKHAFFRTKKETAPVHIEIYILDSKVLTTTATYSTDTWYFFAITNDGTGGTNGVSVYVYSMDGQVVTNENADHAGDPSDLTAALIIAARGPNRDHADGDLAYLAYFTEEFTQAEVKGYFRNPYQVTAQKRSNCVFFLPLNGSSPEVDLSGNGNTGTITGSPTLSAMPPVSAYIHKPGIYLTAAAAGGGAMPQAQDHYFRRRAF
jgi:hypothetical protein